MSENTQNVEVQTVKRANRRNLYIITLCVSIAFIALGVSSAWATPVLPKFTKNETKVEISPSEVSVMVSMYPLGFAAGSVASRFTADSYGRRVTILGSAIPIAIGSFILLFATKAGLLCVTAFLWQCGTGLISTVIGYYLSEIADKDIRATLQLITGFAFKFGNLLTMTLGPFLPYDTLNYIMLALPISFFVVCLWIPETPHYCLKKRNVEGARKSLRKLRRYRYEDDLELELEALKSDVRADMSRSSTLRELFTGVHYRKAIIIAAGLKVTQILTGTVLIRQYLGWIMAETEMKMDIAFLLIVYGCITFAISLISSILVDRMGRRPLLIYSYVGTGVSLAVIALYFFLQDVIQIDRNILSTYSFVPFLGIILSTGIATLGFNSLIFVIPAEIFPMNVKAIAMASLNLLGSALGFLASICYQFVKDHCGLTTIFSIFAAVSFGGAIFSYYLVIETKGKGLGDIQMELQGNFFKAVAIDDKDGVAGDRETEVPLKNLEKSDANKI